MSAVLNLTHAMAGRRASNATPPRSRASAQPQLRTVWHQPTVGHSRCRGHFPRTRGSSSRSVKKLKPGSASCAKRSVRKLLVCAVKCCLLQMLFLFPCT